MNNINCLNIHITNECNMRCLHCLYSSGEIKRPEMSTNSVKRLITQFSEYCPNGTVNIFGGEALIRDDIFEIFRFVKKQGLSLGLTTNGKCISNFFSEILDIGFNRISIDLDGGNKKTHDWLRNEKGHFAKTTSLISRLLTNNVDVSVTSVLNKTNILELESILDTGYRLEISTHAFYMMTPLGRATALTNEILSGREWLSAKNTIIDWCKKRKPLYPIIWENAYRDSTISPEYFSLCGAKGITSLDVSCEGDVYFCGLLTAVRKHSIGNVVVDGFSHILKQIETNAIEKNGCSALALANDSYKGGVLFDPREREDTIIPTCPYDWEILNIIS